MRNTEEAQWIRYSFQLVCFSEFCHVLSSNNGFRYRHVKTADELDSQCITWRQNNPIFRFISCGDRRWLRTSFRPIWSDPSQTAWRPFIIQKSHSLAAVGLCFQHFHCSQRQNDSEVMRFRTHARRRFTIFLFDVYLVLASVTLCTKNSCQLQLCV